MRKTTVLKNGWEFRKESDNSTWEVVSIPHDWAINGPFCENNDRSIRKSDLSSKVYTGKTAGLPHVGCGTYRLTLPSIEPNRRITLEFDGVMSHSEVFINNRYVGGRPYGYSSFCIDITDHVTHGDDNILTVKATVKPQSSRWYPGAGIYRNVRLVQTGWSSIAYNGVHVIPLNTSSESAELRVNVELEKPDEGVAVHYDIISPNGECICAGQALNGQAIINISKPLLWSLRTPVLYTANISVTDKCRVTDNYEMRFGVRNLQITREHGILLNGEHVRLNGVCMHHDLGALGAAVNRSAIRRQLEIMKDMGCNAIRTSHNPPAPEFLDLCDEMGFLVIDEAFDEWQLAKVENGYHTLFDEWAKRDLSDFIRRDRNHPCVMMWSIGNEIHEQRCPDGSKICRSLVEICHQLDQTRPVCAGFDQDFDAEKNGLCAAVDVVGLNYKPAHYAQHLLKHPDWILFGSETASCVSSRGRYYIPVNETHHPLHEDLHVSSYDVEAPHWANLPDYEFEGQDDNPQILGEFVWTGFDYLGEPTPYYSQWPSRSSYFGIVDLCGLKKDRFFAYQARWSGKPVMHVMPHWNWKRGMHVPIHCYTNFMCAELFVNGKSYGVRHKSFESTLARYRLIWDDIPYEPGKLDVISYDSNGHEAMRTSVRTAGDPSRIMLYPEKTVIPADAETYNWIRVQVEDDEGNVCPHADPMIIFSIDGAGELVACDNGDQTDLMPFYLPRRRATHGQCIVIVKANSPGEIVLSAKAENLDGIETVVCTAI